VHHATGQAKWKERAVAAFDPFLELQPRAGAHPAEDLAGDPSDEGPRSLMMTLVTAQDLRATWATWSSGAGRSPSGPRRRTSPRSAAIS
jgi:hypothetical protein